MSVSAAIGALNGLLGDYLVRTNNALALEMECIHDGEPLPLERAALECAHPNASPRVVVLVHGSMCTESIWQHRDGSDFGTLLARDLGLTPYRVRYNSGLRISDSGRALSELFEKLIAAHPVPVDEIVPIGFSMGGLVIRNACSIADAESARWLSCVRRAVYIGTPHRGALLERAGRALTRLLRRIDDPYTELAATIGDLRSDGVKDLGDSCPVPLLPRIEHYLVAGSLSPDHRLASLFGDALVPVPSATDGLCDDRQSMALPPSHVKLLTGVAHLALPRHPDVYAQIRAWCEGAP